MSNSDNQQDLMPQETPKEDEKKADEKKAEESGNKSEYKGNNPGGSGWKDKKKA
jgi:hypothetical protein